MRASIDLLLVAFVAASCGGSESEAPTDTSPAEPAATAAAATSPPPSSTPTAPANTAAPTTVATPVTTATPEGGGGEFATFDPPPDGQNWLQISVRGGASLNEEPELCLILNEGEFGQIRAQNLALDWSDGEWTLGWNYVGGTFSAPVTGRVEEMTATFEGEADGVAVRGSVTCFEA
jgi:hypothetical protein